MTDLDTQRDGSVKEPLAGEVVLRHSPQELRDVAAAAAVERVWQRIAESSGELRQRRPRQVWLWVLAPSLATFVAGIWIGTQAQRVGLLNPDLPPTRLSAEPQTGARALLAVREGERADRQDVLGVSLPRLSASNALAAASAVVLPLWPGLESKTPTASQDKLNADKFSADKQLTDKLSAARNNLGPAAGSAVTLAEPGTLPESRIASEPGADLMLAEGPRSSLARAPMTEAVAGEIPVWQREANAGEYQAALSALKQSSGFENEVRRASAEQLMLLFDIARATGQPQRALAALRRIVAEFPADPVAPLATWSLGTFLEKLGDPLGARRAFATYRVLAPAGEFAEDSLVRELRYAMSAGETEAARTLVEAYSNDFPTGRRRMEVARLARQLAARKVASPDGGIAEGDDPLGDDGDDGHH